MVHRSVKKRPQHCSTAVGQGTILRHVGAAAGKEVQANPCGPFLHRGCNQTKGNPKTVGFWRRFCSLLPPRAKGCRAGARNIPAGGKRAGRGCSPQSKNEKRAAGTPAPAGCATEAARNDPRPGRGIPFLHLTTKAQKIATQGQLFPPRVIAFGHAASKRTLTGCLLSAFVCVILGNDSTNRNLWNRQAFYNRSSGEYTRNCFTKKHWKVQSTSKTIPQNVRRWRWCWGLVWEI